MRFDVYWHVPVNLQTELASIQAQLARLVHQGERIMGTQQELKDAIAAERAEVQTKLSGLVQQITDLQALLAAGTLTSADFDALIASVQAISEPMP